MTYSRIFSVLIATLVVAVAWPAFVQSQQDAKAPGKAFMRLKLEPAKQILEGIATENFDMIVASAQRIQTLTLDERWSIAQSERYMHNSLEFQQTVKAIAEAAREKNLDGATLAYTRMTFSCVGCHRDLRREKPVKANE